MPENDIKSVKERQQFYLDQMITDEKGKPSVPPDTFWNYMGKIMPPFKMGKPSRPLCWRVGFNGPPGGGKSVSCAWMVGAQFLLRGIPVFSIPESYYIKIPILWESKVYVFHSQPLEIDRLIMFDEALQGTCVVADEANLQLADSHRSMSNKNLGVSDYVQQARHHGVSLLYTCILPNWIDPRLRQLTDVLIYCTDNANTPSGEEAGLEDGEWCTWTVTDQSGQLSGTPFEVDPQYYNWSIHLKDYWRITDSFNKVDSIAARQNIKFHDESRVIGEAEVTEDSRADEVRGMAVSLQDTLLQYAGSDKAIPDNRGRILVAAQDLWAMANNIGIADRPLAHRILTETMGVATRTRDKRNFYDITDFVSSGATN